MAITVPHYTVADLDDFPDDGNRYELLDGVLLVTPAPGFPHQSIASQLALALGMALQLPGHAWVLSPGAISFPPRTQLEPDVLVVPSRFPRNSQWRDITEHWLAVEILSRSSRFYDRAFKRDAYLDRGVKEVWLVDMWAQTVEVSRTRGQVETVRDAVRWEVPVVSVTVTIDLGGLFAGVR